MSLEHAPQREKKGRGSRSNTDAVERLVYSIPEFCAAHRLSQSMYYKIRALGKGPREGRVLTKPIITFESAAEWRRACEAAALAPAEPQDEI